MLACKKVGVTGVLAGRGFFLQESALALLTSLEEPFDGPAFSRALCVVHVAADNSSGAWVAQGCGHLRCCLAFFNLPRFQVGKDARGSLPSSSAIW